MKTLSVLLLLLFSCACTVKYNIVTAAHSIPVGAVIQDSDLATRSVKLIYPINRLPRILTEDRSRVIGHAAKIGYVAGQDIYLNQIAP